MQKLLCRHYLTLLCALFLCGHDQGDGVLGVNAQGLTDVTSDTGLSGINGVIASFGDFDSDRDTDIFIITEAGRKVEIYLWQGSKQKFAKASANVKVSSDKVISNVSPADFDGDGCMDILVVTYNANGKGHSTATIHWSDNKNFVEGYKAEMLDEPSIIDTNGDLLPDLFGTDISGERTYWISLSGTPGKRRQFETQIQGNSTVLSKVKIPNSNAFVDMTRDFHADLFIVAEGEQNHVLFETWQSKKGSLEFNSQLTKELPKGVSAPIIAQLSFADFDADGVIDVLVPICHTEDCAECSFYLQSKGEWILMLSNHQSWWQFPLPRRKGQGTMPFQMVARVGDISMDGFPDAVSVFQNIKDGEKSVVILENVPCPVRSISCQGGRTFNVRWNVPILKNLRSASAVTLFDLYENGALDFLVVEEHINTAKFEIKAVKNDFSADTSFLKISGDEDFRILDCVDNFVSQWVILPRVQQGYVLSGRCYKKCTCRSSHTPYGANQAGAMVRYETTNPDGKSLTGMAVQLCQSAYLSLQLPYIVFGLGRTPNFVDEVEVGIPLSYASGTRVHQWQSLIPNSQVIILPYPPDSPSEWLTKLLVTPSKLLLQVGGVLLGICLLVAGLILILHIKEKREDEREKRQEAHKFHFDAL